MDCPVAIRKSQVCIGSLARTLFIFFIFFANNVLISLCWAFWPLRGGPQGLLRGLNRSQLTRPWAGGEPSLVGSDGFFFLRLVSYSSTFKNLTLPELPPRRALIRNLHLELTLTRHVAATVRDVVDLIPLFEVFFFFFFFFFFLLCTCLKGRPCLIA